MDALYFSQLSWRGRAQSIKLQEQGSSKASRTKIGDRGQVIKIRGRGVGAKTIGVGEWRDPGQETHW